MISADRLLPQQQIYNFLRSVTIKYDPIAQYINNSLVAKGYVVNNNDPTTWKYYLNMIGQYHESDTLMYVTSLDTRKQILFSIATLAQNPRTRSAYIPGGQYYNRLCEIYPEQVDLIKSILFPVPDITKAIMSDDLTLLSYGSGYLEVDEEPVLVDALRDFLDVIKERWYFNFLDDEPYFYLTFWGCLWTYLAAFLLGERMANIRTPYVHSWYIWNELQAHGLQNYSDLLDRKKSMMLYQNIDYLKANAGKQSNLIILANRLLADFGAALYGRMVVQESETGASNYQLTPQLVPIRIPTDYATLATEIATESVSAIQSQIFSKGLTPKDDAETVQAVERKLSDTTLNNFMTKFLEIRPIALNKPYAELLDIFLMETLVVAIAEGYYANSVEVIDPLTNNPIFLPPKDLLALYNYSAHRSLGIIPTEFPTKANIYKAFDTEIRTPAATLPRGDETIYISMQVNSSDYLSGLNYDTNLQSPIEFSEMLSRLWLRFMTHTLADQNTALDKRGYIYQYLASLCHTRREMDIELVTGFDNYTDWLSSEGVDIQTTIISQYNLQPPESNAWKDLSDAIISALVPLTSVISAFGNFTLSDTGYDRLRQLFIQMCSYRVVFLESIRDTSEYAAGAKWSTDYGKAESDSISDLISAINQETTIDSKIQGAMYLHNGVKEILTVAAESDADYDLKMASTTVSDESTYTVDRPRYSMAMSSSSVSSGSLRKFYTQTIPVPSPSLVS